jgi:Flp pilus assembly protein TadD
MEYKKRMKNIFLTFLFILPLTGCLQRGDVTGSINAKRATMEEGRSLRLNGQTKQAVAVLQKGVMTYGEDKELLGEYGRALADNRDFDQAMDVLSRAHTPEKPDWRILNTQGIILDQTGRMVEARQYYKDALKLSPNEPQILANAGLSFALSGKPAEGEKLLREAQSKPSDPKTQQSIQQNLDFVIALQKKK